MIGGVIINKKGIFVREWNSDKKKWFRKRAKKNQVCSYLRHACNIEEGTTLGDIFNAVDKYQLLKFVISSYAQCSAIDEFHEQATWPAPEKEDKQPLTHLEIFWYVDDVKPFSKKIKHKGGNKETIHSADFELNVGFHGIGANPDEEEREKRPTVSYSVSYSPMYELEHLPVILDKTFEVYDWKTKREFFKSERYFTFLEVLDSIYYDISFVGGPKDNAAFIGEMQERVKEIEGGLPLIPLEQVQKQLGEEVSEGPMKVLMHPQVAEFFGIDPDSIPLDDKEIMKKEKEEKK